MSNERVMAIKANVEQLTATYDKMFAMCLRQLKPLEMFTKADIMQRALERKALIEALENYLAAKKGNDKEEQ